MRSLALVCLALCACDLPASRFEFRVDGGLPMGGGMGGGRGGGVGGGGGFGPGGGVGGGMGGGGGSPFDMGPPVLLGLPSGPAFEAGPLRATSLAPLAGERTLVAVVPDADDLFLVGVQPSPTRIPLPTGGEPSSVAVTRDRKAWVTLRALGKLARVDLVSKRVDVVLDVGAEPVGVALSPSGGLAVVTTFGERSVAIVDTARFTVTHVEVGGRPRGVAISDDGDTQDSDESAWVTLFYGEPLAEGSDAGRRGVVVEVPLAGMAATRRVELRPIPVAGASCSPNQLYAIALSGRLGYVAHVCAAPSTPLGQDSMTFAALSVFDLDTATERPLGPGGSLVIDAIAASFAAVPVDVTPSSVFPGQRSVAMLSQGANNVTTVLEQAGVLQQPLTAGSSGPSPYGPIGLDPAGGAPTDGVPTAIYDAYGETFVLDATGRRISRLRIMAPPESARFELPPTGATLAERLGKKFFHTALGRWSARDRLACSSCHPDGLSDNLTWVFGAGPRQTPSLDGTFAKGNRSDHRAQNWTANFDEIADVEGVIRNLAGGLGAITMQGPMGEVPVPLSTPRVGPGGLTRNDGLSGSTTELVDTVSLVKDWNEVAAWIASIRTPSSSRRLDPAAVARGRLLFATGGCAACHGGPKWTVSRVPYVPGVSKNGTALGDSGAPPLQPTGLRTEQRTGGLLWNPALNVDTMKIAVESTSRGEIGPERITCVLRNVGTYDASNPFERKASGAPSQGQLGFNPPSLLGVALTAPYLHHGEAKTLAELFSPRYAAHHQAFRRDFLAQPGPGEIDDLVAFLESIDGTTEPFEIPVGADVCGTY